MKKLVLSQSVYTWCKWIVIIVLPALSSFITGLGKVWGWDSLAANIAATVTLVATFLGAILCISNYNFYKNKEDNSNEDV